MGARTRRARLRREPAHARGTHTRLVRRCRCRRSRRQLGTRAPGRMRTGPRPCAAADAVLYRHILFLAIVVSTRSGARKIPWARARERWGPAPRARVELGKGWGRGLPAYARGELHRASWQRIRHLLRPDFSQAQVTEQRLFLKYSSRYGTGLFLKYFSRSVARLTRRPSREGGLNMHAGEDAAAAQPPPGAPRWTLREKRELSARSAGAHTVCRRCVYAWLPHAHRRIGRGARIRRAHVPSSAHARRHARALDRTCTGRRLP